MILSVTPLLALTVVKLIRLRSASGVMLLPVQPTPDPANSRQPCKFEGAYISSLVVAAALFLAAMQRITPRSTPSFAFRTMRIPGYRPLTP